MVSKVIIILAFTALCSGTEVDNYGSEVIKRLIDARLRFEKDSVIGVQKSLANAVDACLDNAVNAIGEQYNRIGSALQDLKNVADSGKGQSAQCDQQNPGNDLGYLICVSTIYDNMDLAGQAMGKASDAKNALNSSGDEVVAAVQRSVECVSQTLTGAIP